MSPKIWRLVGVAAALVLVVASWFALVSPTLQDASALQEEAQSQEAASNQLRSRISLLKKQSEELPAQEAILAGIQQRMPSETALPTLIRNLTAVAEAGNVTVSVVSPGRPTAMEVAAPAPTKGKAAPVSAESGAQSMSLNITACGTFAQLRSYLRELEQMRRVLAVSGLSIAKGSCGEGSAPDDLTATIRAAVFTLPSAVVADSPVKGSSHE